VREDISVNDARATRLPLACALVGAVLCLSVLHARAQNAVSSNRAPSAQTCAAVGAVTALPNPSTVITSAVFNPLAEARPSPNAFAPPTPALPEHCEVVGKMNERTGVNDQRYWVEKGVAPERIVATSRVGTPWPGRTRPLCVYPAQARYKGTGSVEDAGNFTCR
jgi:hypothetical protein